MTKIFEKNENEFYDDYAHHPTEISSVLSGVEKVYKNKELISAQNSRIKYFFSDAGVRSCYFKMKKEGRIPSLWSEVIERAMQ